jgi:N-acylneuraminate cytidylyltransferase
MKLINECWAFIPARSGSKTIINKNIKLINKKPLIFYTLNFAKKNNFFKKIVFSSDSENYLRIASKFGKFYLHKRNKFSSTSTATDLDAFKNFINDHLKLSRKLPKYFAHLRPTTPIRSKKTVNKALTFFFKNSQKYTSLRTVNKMSETSFKSLRIVEKKLCAILKKDFDLDKYNKPQKYYPTTYVANGILDIYLTSNILKNTLLGKRVFPYIVKDINSDIDTIHDFKYAEYNLKKKIF